MKISAFKSVLVLLALLPIGTIHARLPHLNSTTIATMTCQTNWNQKKCQRIVERHLIRDLKSCQIDPKALLQAPKLLSSEGIKQVKVHGRNAFLGFLPFPYSYTGIVKNDSLEISAKVYFTNHAQIPTEELQEMQIKLDSAAKKWTLFNPYPFKVRFKFEITKIKKEANVKAKLLLGKDTRGPYFSLWSSRWEDYTIAHEMGHVMGLDDEYSNTPFRKLNYCDRNSIMCTSGDPYPYHYYLILRRLLCRI